MLCNIQYELNGDFPQWRKRQKFLPLGTGHTAFQLEVGGTPATSGCLDIGTLSRGDFQLLYLIIVLSNVVVL